MHGDAGVSFATALRSILRQDPDVVMIGEMRDSETAEIAVQAAMTGISSSPRFIRTTRSARFPGSSIWEYRTTSYRPLSKECSRRDSCVAYASNVPCWTTTTRHLWPSLPDVRRGKYNCVAVSDAEHVAAPASGAGWESSSSCQLTMTCGTPLRGARAGPSSERSRLTLVSSRCVSTVGQKYNVE